MIRRVPVIIACVLGFAALPADRASAQARPCVHTTLPGDLPRAADWQAHLDRELSSVAQPVPLELSGPCAELSLHRSATERNAIDIDIRTPGMSDSATIVLDDVMLEHRPRVTALIASDMLRALLSAVPSEHATSAPTPLRRRRLSLPFYARGDLPTRGASPLHGFHLLVGARSYIEHAPKLLRVELGFVRRSSAVPWLRGGLGLVGDSTFLHPVEGELRTGSVGPRVEGALRIAHFTGLELWLGPAVEVGALIVAQDPRGSVRLTRDLYALASADARLRLDVPVRGRLLLFAAFDVGGSLRPLTFRSGDHTLLAYRSVYASLSIGIALMGR